MTRNGIAQDYGDASRVGSLFLPGLRFLAVVGCAGA
jgi:hypothetical protein